MIKQMNVFITGATGFLGTELVKGLVGEGHQVYLLIRSMKKANALLEHLPITQRHQVHFCEGNLETTKLGLTEQTLQNLVGKIDIVFHTAAFLSFDEAHRDVIFKTNLNGTNFCLEFAKEINVKKFIYVSTAYTLGNQTTGQEELYSLNTTFVNSYEESKCHSEHAVIGYSDRFSVAIMRPSIIVGNSITGKANTTFGMYGILKAVQLLKKRSIKMNKEIAVRLLVDKNTVSNIVPVDYVVQALLLAMKYSKNETVYHLTNPNPPTNEFVIEMIKDVFDYQSLSLASIEEAPHLTDFELSINKPLEVFKEYLNRSIYFPTENTNELFSRNGQALLKMDGDMLYRIISGFSKEAMVSNK
ncbi:SDR family oxidoreductase [Anaerobacillus isosaccharinicus]|uniref:SDR family oxidoreductase n=2 Tax=Anaerobacillus isosaccharinicus TaxID=1532552 RepID=A0A7S7RE30_9BACI|nr:SDR family oxidoreductase [Anaerobacillus isosaccharinicus]